MHVKDFLAGKRGKCPQCGRSIRIPAHGEERSLPIVSDARPGDNEPSSVVVNASVEASESSHVFPSAAVVAPASPPESTEGSQKNIPTVISEAPNAAWYVRPPSGGQYGPAIGLVFWEWLNEKRVGENSLVWREGWGTWQTAKDTFPNFFGPTSLPIQVPAKSPTVTSNVSPPTPASASASMNPVNSPASMNPATTNPSAAIPLRESFGVDSTAESRRTVQMRRKKKQSQNLVMLVSLAVVAVMLVIALIAVLVWQNSTN